VNLTGAKIYNTFFYDIEAERIHCDWVDLSPNGDGSKRRDFKEGEFLEYIREFHRRAKNNVLPRLFISYMWPDREAVLKLDRWLRTKDLRVEINEINILAGGAVQNEILYWLERCSAVILVYSKNSKGRFTKNWDRLIREELSREATRRNHDMSPLIYFCLDDTPLAIAPPDDRMIIRAGDVDFETTGQKILDAALKK
jgi:hypothetical protein